MPLDQDGYRLDSLRPWPQGSARRSRDFSKQSSRSEMQFAYSPRLNGGLRWSGTLTSLVHSRRRARNRQEAIALSSANRSITLKLRS